MVEGISIKYHEKRGRWTINETRKIYSNQHGLRLDLDNVTRPDGKPGIRTRITSKPGVYAVPVFPNGDVGLINEFYYNLNETCPACVTGGVDEDKSPLETAIEELKQERGLTASDWTFMGNLNPTGLVKVDTSCFLARDLNEEMPKLEGAETIKSIRMPLEKAIDMIGTEITDACSATSLFMANRIISKEKK